MKSQKFKFSKNLTYLASISVLRQVVIFERLPTIAELVISPYPTISQQFLGFKKLSFGRVAQGNLTPTPPQIRT